MTTGIAVVLALVAAFAVGFVEGAAPARCKSYFELLELQSPNGPRHTGLVDVFDADARTENGRPVPNKMIFFSNKIYKGCGSDYKTPAITFKNKAGVSHGHCVEVFAPAKFIDCYYTWVLEDGLITTQGQWDLSTGRGKHVVTGGSGKYFGVKGEVDAVFGAVSPTKCSVPAAVKSAVSPYTFCLDKPNLEP